MISQDLIKITDNEVLSQLPNPFLFENGTQVHTIEGWKKRKEELYHIAIELPFGKQPPKPEFLHVETLGLGSRSKTYRIIAGPADHPVSFRMFLFIPSGAKAPWPVAIDGDLCWDYSFNQEYLQAFLSRGIALVLFDRLELAADLRDAGRRSPLYRAYPDLNFGALSAWAWGYSRCVDALLNLGLADPDCIAFTGHSRGGKAALLAGALDERATIVNPNNSGCGGCGCYRIRAKGITEDGKEERNETLEDILDQFDYWFSPTLKDYYNHAEQLPFDQHELKALVAPRILLEGNAASDLWANPVGSVQTAVAADEVYKFLGAEKNHYWYFRTGYHWHKPEDVTRLAKLMRSTKDGTEVDDSYAQAPFHLPKPIFDWSAPSE